MKDKIYIIPIHTITYDNGDGGYTIEIFNNEDELIENHRKVNEMTDELREEILSSDNEYENGYLDKNKIEIVIKNGKAFLNKPVCFGAGQ